MMRYKSSLILLVLVILLGLYLYLIELPGQKAKQQEEERTQKIANFEPDEAIGLYLSYPKRPAGQEILLEKDSENKWQIVKPITFPADQSGVQGLLSSIGSMKMERVVEEKAQDLKIYGLDQPEIKVSVKLKDHEEHLLFGDSAPVGSTMYVMRSGEDIVRLTDQFYKTSLTKTVTDLRKKEVLDLDPQSVKQLTLQYSGQAFVLTKEDGRWWIKKPSVFRADDEVISDMLEFLKRLRAKDFVDQGTTELLKSFQKPSLKLEMESENGATATLSIFEAPDPSKGEPKTYAVTNTSSPVYLIDAKAITDLEKDTFTLKDKHLLAFDPDQVQVVEIRKASDEALTARREGNGWSFEGQTLEESKAQKITELLNNLSGLKADKMVEETPTSKNPFGLNPPQFRINLLNSQQNKLAELMIGSKNDDLVYVRSGLSEDIYMVRSHILEDLPQKSDLKGHTTPKSS
jgi:hypothetical protein